MSTSPVPHRCIVHLDNIDLFEDLPLEIIQTWIKTYQILNSHYGYEEVLQVRLALLAPSGRKTSVNGLLPMFHGTIC